VSTPTSPGAWFDTAAHDIDNIPYTPPEDVLKWARPLVAEVRRLRGLYEDRKADWKHALGERDALRAAIQAVETVRDNLANAMRLGGDAGHVIDGRWILRRLDEVLPLAAGVDREDTEQPPDKAKLYANGSPLQLERFEVGDTGQADEPQPTDRREWTQADVPDLLAAMGGLVVPQQPSDYEHDEKCEHAALQQSHGVRMCRCALRAGLIPGPVGQDTTGEQHQ
jgi:hypothetical protein